MPGNRSAEGAPRGEKYGLGRTESSGQSVSVRDVDPVILHRAVSAVVDGGDLIMFTQTSEGGAVLVRIMADGLKEEEYCSSVESLQDALTTLAG